MLYLPLTKSSQSRTARHCRIQAPSTGVRCTLANFSCFNWAVLC